MIVRKNAGKQVAIPIPDELAEGDRVKIRWNSPRTAQRHGVIVWVGPVHIVVRDDQGFTQSIRREHAARRLSKIEPVSGQEREARIA